MVTRSVWRPMKDEAIGDQGAVTAATPLASEVGIEILRRGGNAVDAAVAMGFCLAVVEPMSSCIAGHGQMLVHMGGKGGVTLALEYGHRAPKLATANMYKVLGQSEEGNGIYEVEGRANAIGYQAVGVPGVAAGLCRAHDLFGTLPLAQLLEPAIHYAEEGFVSDSLTTLRISDAISDFTRHGEPARVFLPDGHPPVSGQDKLVQRDLGRTLRRIVDEGARALYQGEIPYAIEEDMKKNGGLLRVPDFTEYRVGVSTPASISYRGYQVLGIPLPSGCTTALQTLKILENYDVLALRSNSLEYLHLFAEAGRHTFADRYRYLGDPDFVPVPLESLLSDQYAAKIAGTISLDERSFRAAGEEQPWVTYSHQSAHDPWEYEPEAQPAQSLPSSPPNRGDCTTHFGVADRDRNIVSCTQTAVNSFGSRVMTPNTGILLSNAMVAFNPMPGAANSIAGYKRTLANMTPLLVLRDGEPFLSIGAPGGRKIINCNTQVVVNVLDFNMGIQEALAAPRIDVADRETFVDERIDPSTIEGMDRMGHDVVAISSSSALGFDSRFARPSGIMIHPETNLVHAGVDVFSPSEALSY